MPASRPSNTKGKHIFLSSPPLPKGQACEACKARRVRCDGALPACAACKRSARHLGQDDSAVVCCYPGLAPRKKRKDSQPSVAGSKPVNDPVSTFDMLDAASGQAATAHSLPSGDLEEYLSQALLTNHLTRFRSLSSDCSSASSTYSGEGPSVSASPVLGSPVLRDSPESFQFDIDALTLASDVLTGSVRTNSIPSLSSSQQSTPMSMPDVTLPMLPPLHGMSQLNLTLKTPTPALPYLSKPVTSDESSFSYFDIPVLVTSTAPREEEMQPNSAVYHKPGPSSFLPNLLPPTPLLIRTDLDWAAASSTSRVPSESSHAVPSFAMPSPGLGVPSSFGQAGAASLCSPLAVPLTPNQQNPDWQKFFLASSTMSPVSASAPSPAPHTRNAWSIIGSVF
ncbi:hypothetical protein OIV83_005236 [Microbotryomycetes sp. JL201]|nr:hypothetical protein OIV83_005236 [Microbotryomycetes sp. JL201]